jgi:glc operon protein GlcG
MPVLRTISTLGDAGAQLVMQAAAAEADRHGWAVSIAVVDLVGNLLAYRGMDGSSVASITGSLEKARSAAQIRRPTRELQAIIDEGHPSYLGIHWITSLEGGVPIIVDSVVIGAVGASGVLGHEDHQVAQAGVDAVLRHVEAIAVDNR